MVLEIVDPVMVMDIGGQCQVSVVATSCGTILRFDGPNGEIQFRITDDAWQKIEDAVWLAKKSMGVFDMGKEERDGL